MDFIIKYSKEMFEVIKQLVILIDKSDKIWIIVIILFLIIVALFIIAAKISPVPFFIYPII